MNARIGRRGVLKGAAGFGAAVPLVGTLGMAPARAARAQEGGSGGIVVFDLGSEPENLDPHQALAYTTARLDEQICEPLVRFVPGTLDIQPWLAASWETSPDGLEWAFTLQPDVTFHDGSPLDAETVKFSFDRQLDEESPYFAMGQWASAVELNIIDAIRVDAPDVVTFTLTGPYSKFLSRMAVSAGALTTPDAEEAKANYMRAQEIVMEQAPIVPVCHKQQIYGVSNRVQGFAALPSMELDLRNAWVEG
jgi:ABC-type transport system substrate-binding protein